LRAAELAHERTARIADDQRRERQDDHRCDRGGRPLGRSDPALGVRGQPARLEGTRLYGEGLPLDANKGTGFDKICFRLGRAALMVAAGARWAGCFPRSLGS